MRRRRQEHKITQTDLARKIGLSVSQMNNIENGRALPSLAVYFRLCMALGVRKPPFSP